MRADIQAEGFTLSDSIRRSIERAAQANFEAFAGHIAFWRVRVFDLNGARGGADMACRVHVRLKRGPELVVFDAQDDLYTAIASAFSRLGYALALQADRRTRHGRASIRHYPGDLAA